MQNTYFEGTGKYQSKFTEIRAHISRVGKSKLSSSKLTLFSRASDTYCLYHNGGDFIRIASVRRLLDKVKFKNNLDGLKAVNQLKKYTQPHYETLPYGLEPHFEALIDAMLEEWFDAVDPVTGRLILDSPQQEQIGDGASSWLPVSALANSIL